jgi:glycosyltransferase involved in cell wall biosynthesis
MAKVSVIIPARNEPYLERTINEVFDKATASVECIVTLDGYLPSPMPITRDNLTFIHKPQSEGMRAAINSAVAASTGKYIFKLDAHCLLSQGYDEALQRDCEPNWVVVPRRYRLDVDKWEISADKPEPIDYHYLSYPHNDKNPGLHGTPWKDRAKERALYLIDDEMSSQGSAYFMHRAYFTDFLGGLHEEGYGSFIQEFQEIGMKCWLSGGRVAINKRAFYCHWHKPSRGYSLSKSEAGAGTAYSTDFWMNNRWPGRKHDIEWLIERFAPVPGWPSEGKWAA